MTDIPSEDQLFQLVAAKLAEQKGIEASEVALDSRFEDLGVDSLDAMEILFEVEEEYDLDIPDTAARSMRTVSNVVDVLGKLLRGEELDLPEPVAEATDGDDNSAGSTPSAAAGG